MSSEAYIHAIIDGTPDAYVAVDLLGTVTAFNRAAEALFELPAPEMLGRSIAKSRLPESLRECFASLLCTARAGELPARRDLEIEGPLASGEAWLAKVNLFATGAGKEAILVACLHDITGRRQTETKILRLSQILRTM